MTGTPCQHREAHRVDAQVHFIEDDGRFTVDFKVRCDDCGQPFRFIGLPMGLDLRGGATVSTNHEEARLVIHPSNEDPPASTGVTGFKIREIG